MAYRDSAADELEAPTADGTLQATLGPNRATLRVADRTLTIGDGFATLVEAGKQRSFELAGALVIVRGHPREDLAVWLADDAAARRVFGVQPQELVDAGGLHALRKLDAVFYRLRTTLADHTRGATRAVEIGSGNPLDKVLLADFGDRYALYARGLFRQAAERILVVHADGRVVVPGAKRAATLHSRFGVTVRGDYLRFADREGTDLARVAIPWISPEDRDEVARRIGQLVDREPSR